MWEPIKYWLEFWGNCILTGWHFGDWTLGILEAVSVVIYGTLHRKKLYQHLKWWESLVMKLTWKFFLLAFFITTFLIAPFLKFQEADKQKTTQEKFDYINQNRPYLEAELVIESIDTNANTVFYHFEVQNNGNLAALFRKEEQKSPYFTFPEFQAHNKFLA